MAPADSFALRQLDSAEGGIADPQEDLPRAAEFLELGEDELDGTLNPLVRIQLDAPALVSLRCQACRARQAWSRTGARVALG